MRNTRVFNDDNIVKLNGFLEYLFSRSEKYTISVKKEKEQFVFIVRW